MAVYAARQRQIEEGGTRILNEEHHCLKARAMRKIDLAKPQQAECHLFGDWVNNRLNSKRGTLKIGPGKI